MLQKIAYGLVLLMIFMVPWEGVVTISGIGSLTRAIGFVAFGAWVGIAITTGTIRKPLPFHLLILAFLLWNMLTIVWTKDLDLTQKRLVTYLQVAIMMWLIWNLIVTKTDIRLALQAYVLGAAISVYTTISNYFLGVDTGRHSVRFSAFGINENGLALMIALAIPMAWHLAVSADKNSKIGLILKAINFAYVPLAIFAILLTASRTALFSIIPAFWFILGSSTRLKPVPRLMIAVGMVMAIYILQPLIPQTSIDRLSTASTEIEDGTLGGRTSNWEEGIDVFLGDPILGVGSGAYRTATEMGKVAHNTYISLLVEIGFIGFIMFVLILVITIFHVRLQPTKWESTLWITVLLTWLISISTMTFEHKKPTWLILSFIAAGVGASNQLKAKVQLKNSRQEDDPSIILAKKIP